tara:strand:- start:1021 stop:2442 length:1422 start_codon:yes stop_codon:yes gene_type:complete
MATYSRDFLTQKHKHYEEKFNDWHFHLMSYLGGQDYQNGFQLNRYILESDEEYMKRSENTPIDNHCKNVVQIYSSFLFRVPPTRDYGTLTGDPQLQSFIDDADLDGRSFDNVIREMQMNASIYGTCWAILDKPAVQSQSRAEEIQLDIRPYISLYTSENVLNWNFERSLNGKYVLTSLTLLEDLFEDVATIRVWTMEDITTYMVADFSKGYSTGKPIIKDEMPNMLGKIPAVILYNQKSQRRGIGVSDLNDVAELQKGIYNDYSEIEQLIRLSNHPSLVKTPEVEASAGAGSVIEMPSDMDSNLKPYLIQPSSQSLDGIMNNITMKVEAINRITHMGAIRATETRVQSGIALQTEFQLLNARLSEKADYLQNAEEQIWKLFAEWQDKEFDGEIIYPDSFNLRDYASDLQFLQMAKASGVESDTFLKEVDKQIARAVVDDDEKIASIDNEIMAKTESIGQFATEEIEGEEIAEA